MVRSTDTLTINYHLNPMWGFLPGNEQEKCFNFLGTNLENSAQDYIYDVNHASHLISLTAFRHLSIIY